MSRGYLNMNICYIHLGSAPSNHLWKNIERTVHYWPNHDFSVVLSDKNLAKTSNKKVKILQYREEQEVSRLFQHHDYDTKFRRGFWKFSLERLFALVQVHSLNPSTPLLHIESDVLLLNGFPFDAISEKNYLMWTPYNEQRDVAALLYSPNLTHTLLLHQKLIELFDKNPQHTDMTILKAAFNELVPNVKYFPSLGNIDISLKNKENSFEFSKILELSADLPGVFDSAAIGMWLVGHDPRNNYGRYNIHDTSPIKGGDSFVDPTRVKYSILDGRIILESKEKRELLKLWNLHIHSKSLSLFEIDNDSKLTEYIALSAESHIIKKFEIYTLFMMFVESLKTRTVLRFILGLPVVHLARRRLSPIKLIFKRL